MLFLIYLLWEGAGGNPIGYENILCLDRDVGYIGVCIRQKKKVYLSDY